MATKIGPKTVSQRDRSKALVFCIDAAHFNSYGGEPADNLLADPNNFGGDDWNVKNGTWAVGDDPGPHGNGSYSCTATDSDPYAYSSFVRSVSTGNVTFSAWVKGEGATIGTGGDIRINFGSSGGQATGTNTTVNYTITGEWQKVTVTQNVTGAGTIKVGVEAPNSATVGNVVYFSDPQLEQSSTSTPFTATARTASSAVKNISGVGALGTTLTGTFATYGQELFRPANRRVLASFDTMQGHIGGAYWDFDGTDEYINAGTGIMTSEFITISLWVKYGGNSGFSSLQGMVTNNSTSSDRRDFNVSADKFQWIQKTYSDGRIETSTANGPDEGVWTHAVATSKTVGSDTLSKIYKNSIEVGSLTYSSVTMSSGINDACFIGYLNSSRYFNGEIACVSVWSSCLTAKEIKDIYIAQKGRFGK